MLTRISVSQKGLHGEHFVIGEGSRSGYFGKTREASSRDKRRKSPILESRERVRQVRAETSTDSGITDGMAGNAGRAAGCQPALTDEQRTPQLDLGGGCRLGSPIPLRFRDGSAGREIVKERIELAGGEALVGHRELLVLLEQCIRRWIAASDERLGRCDPPGEPFAAVPPCNAVKVWTNQVATAVRVAGAAPSVEQRAGTVLSTGIRSHTEDQSHAPKERLRFHRRLQRRPAQRVAVAVYRWSTVPEWTP